MEVTSKLHFPAPRRAQIPHLDPEGRRTWSSRQWQVEDVETALLSGAWFQSGSHEFASGEAQRIAREGSSS